MSTGPVCVTGASGFIATNLVKQLLDKGYTVHGTVRSLTSDKSAHLHAMAKEYPAGKLQLFEADLLVSSSFDAAIHGCVGVFHTASPFFMKGVTGENAEEKLVRPAIDGTVNVLESCVKAGSVEKVVLTSSFAAVLDPENYSQTYTEENWNVKSKFENGGGEAYRFSKTAAERAAWKFVEDRKAKGEKTFSLVTLNPPFVFGRNLGNPKSVEELNTSSQSLAYYLSGSVEKIPDSGLGICDVDDLARAHIFLYEHPEASGRHLCAGGSLSWQEFAGVLKRLFPTLPIPTEMQNAANPKPSKPILDCSKLKAMGFTFTPVEETLRVQCESILRLGLVKHEGQPAPELEE